MKPAVERGLVLAVLLAASLVACHADRATGPNLVVVTIDTLRADHVGSYGYARATTPRLDELAARGARFAHAYSTASWTAPAMVSLITGATPAQHGIVHGQLEAEPGTREDAGGHVVMQEVLPEAWDTLPEVLGRRGYTTAGFSTNGHLVRSQGFAQGFDHFDEQCLWQRAECVNARVFDWLEQAPPAEPAFLWVHYFDPHHDAGRADRRYDPLPPYDRLFPAEGPARGVERSKALYDGEIRRTDDAIGELIGRVTKHLSPERTVIVLTADHGDEFLERGNWHHTNTVFDELVRVPLIVVGPGVPPGRVVETPVGIADLMPTLLELAGAEAEATEGRSLAPLLRGDDGAEALAGRGLYGETRRWRRLDQRFWLEGSKKLIVDRRADTHRLYDLAADPGERQDRAADEPETVARMQQALDAHLARAEREGRAVTLRPELDPERVEALRALGYLE